jgi:acetyl esterase/lipase
MNQDCLNAYDWVRTELDGLLSTDDAGPTINVDRVSLAGYSAGGYLAAMLVCLSSLCLIQVDFSLHV